MSMRKGCTEFIPPSLAATCDTFGPSTGAAVAAGPPPPSKEVVMKRPVLITLAVATIAGLLAAAVGSAPAAAVGSAPAAATHSTRATLRFRVQFSPLLYPD